MKDKNKNVIIPSDDNMISIDWMKRMAGEWNEDEESARIDAFMKQKMPHLPDWIWEDPEEEPEEEGVEENVEKAKNEDELYDLLEREQQEFDPDTLITFFLDLAMDRFERNLIGILSYVKHNNEGWREQINMNMLNSMSPVIFAIDDISNPLKDHQLSEDNADTPDAIMEKTIARFAEHGFDVVKLFERISNQIEMPLSIEEGLDFMNDITVSKETIERLNRCHMLSYMIINLILAEGEDIWS